MKYNSRESIAKDITISVLSPIQAIKSILYPVTHRKTIKAYREGSIAARLRRGYFSCPYDSNTERELVAAWKKGYSDVDLQLKTFAVESATSDESIRLIAEQFYKDLRKYLFTTSVRKWMESKTITDIDQALSFVFPSSVIGEIAIYCYSTDREMKPSAGRVKQKDGSYIPAIAIAFLETDSEGRISHKVSMQVYGIPAIQLDIIHEITHIIDVKRSKKPPKGIRSDQLDAEVANNPYEVNASYQEALQALKLYHKKSQITSLQALVKIFKEDLMFREWKLFTEETRKKLLKRIARLYNYIKEDRFW